MDAAYIDGHTLGLLRASGPCTIREIRRELLRQAAGVDHWNALDVAEQSVGRLLRAGRIRNEADTGEAAYNVK